MRTWLQQHSTAKASAALVGEHCSIKSASHASQQPSNLHLHTSLSHHICSRTTLSSSCYSFVLNLKLRFRLLLVGVHSLQEPQASCFEVFDCFVLLLAFILILLLQAFHESFKIGF